MKNIRRQICRSVTSCFVLLALLAAAAVAEDKKSADDEPRDEAPAAAEQKPEGEKDGTGEDGAEKPAGKRYEGEGISFDVPEGWGMEPGTGANMRYATLSDGEAEITVSVFPGDVGGMLANVNRWRGQVGLKPITEKELPANVKEVKAAAGTKAFVVDLKGSGGRRLLAASIPAEGKTWFLKMAGAEEVVGKRAETFNALAKSVSVGEEKH